MILYLLVNIHLFVNKTSVINKFLQRLVRLEENWKSIVDNFQEGIIIFNKDFKMLYRNNSIKTIFGYEDEEVIRNREDNNTMDNEAFSIKVHSLKIIPATADFIGAHESLLFGSNPN